jgi:hypothetical protein
LFATGAEGSEDLGETINMRYELAQRAKNADPKEEAPAAGVESGPPEKVEDHFNSPHSPKRTTFHT